MSVGGTYVYVYNRIVSNYTCCHFPKWLSGKESTCQCRTRQRQGFDPWVRKIPWRSKRQPTPVFSARKPRGQRSHRVTGRRTRTRLDDWARARLLVVLSPASPSALDSGHFPRCLHGYSGLSWFTPIFLIPFSCTSELSAFIFLFLSITVLQHTMNVLKNAYLMILIKSLIIDSWSAATKGIKNFEMLIRPSWLTHPCPSKKAFFF